MSRDPFENDINRQFRDAEEMPPDTVWENLEEKMSGTANQSIHPKLQLVSLAAGLAILAALVFYFIPDNRIETDEVSNQVIDTTFVGVTAGSKGVIMMIDTVQPTTAPATVLPWLEADRRLVLFFYNEDCQHCDDLEAVLDTPSIRSLLTERFRMVSLSTRNVENLAFTKKYEIRTVPTLLFFDESGTPVYRLKGSRDEPTLKDLLEKILAGEALPETESQKINTPRPDTKVESRPNHFKVFPNPNKGQFQIEVHNPERSSAKIRVSTIHGRLVREQQIDPVEGRWQESFDLSGEQKGYYVIRIERGTEVLVEKVLIQ